MLQMSKKNDRLKLNQPSQKTSYTTLKVLMSKPGMDKFSFNFHPKQHISIFLLTWPLPTKFICKNSTCISNFTLCRAMLVILLVPEISIR